MYTRPMPLRMWSLDVAREQCISRDLLFRYAAMTADAGYDALGLYLEHRFAYPSAPWAHGSGSLTPETVRAVRSEFPSLKLIPFVNLLGHMEGFLYTEPGKKFREELFHGTQACPLAPGFKAFCHGLLGDVLEAFEPEFVHIGGDETDQLGKCPRCAEFVSKQSGDGKAALWGRHFGAMASWVLDKGSRPAVWGDMLLEHPEALDALPNETLVFDWQYKRGVAETAPRLTRKGFSVVACPTLHVYNAPWLHLEASEQNIRTVSRDAQGLRLEGVCLTTWESGLFGAYDTIFPAIRAARGIMDRPDQAEGLLHEYEVDGQANHDWASLMGVELERLGGPFAYSGIRNSLKARLLLYGNPFLAWMHHGEELAGPLGTEALAVLEKALSAAPDEATKGVTMFVRGAVEFVRLAEGARQAYDQGHPEKSITQLASMRYLFETLMAVARRNHERIGGSMADVERCRAAKDHVERVIRRLEAFGRGELGYLPAFEVITNPRFMPHDQASWWLINRWANQ